MILNFNKPKDWTSFDVVAKVRSGLRKKFNKKKIKVGHAGTLDPLASGVLVLLTDKDTKKQDLIMHKPKEYIAEVALGVSSETDDLEGELHFEESIPGLEDISAKIDEIVQNYVGEIEQQVPIYSAVKVDGKRLYARARSDDMEDIAPPTKTVTIHTFEILDIFEKDLKGRSLPHFKCRVVCGSGTYLRSLARDIGQNLGSKGVLTSLVRSRVGTYTLDDALNIEDLEEIIDRHPIIL